MKNWLSELCGGAFMSHGQCYLWDPSLVTLHAVADSVIALAYFSIPLVLLVFVRRSRDVPFPSIFLMFGAFIVACGTTHLLEVWTIWHPHYWLSGGAKALTAIISLGTAFGLVQIVPAALALPSPAALRKLNEELEDRVAARTVDLTAVNAQLRREATQRELAEAEVRRLNTALEQRVAELQTLFDLMPVGVGIATDATCATIKTNPAFATILGLPDHANASLSAPPDQAPQNFRIFKDGRELAPAELPMQRAVAENIAIHDFEESIIRNDGTTTDLLVRAVPIRDESGRPSGCVAAFQDITAHKQSAQDRLEFERRLREAQKLESIGVLAGGIAHDFNNLLTGILGYTSLVRLNLPPTETQAQRMLASAETSARRAAELCKQLLAYAGKGSYLLRSLALNEVVEKSLTLLRLPLGAATTLRLDLAETLPPCRADAAQLRQVLISLVTNSAEAIGDIAGTVIIRSRSVRIGADDLPHLVAGHHLKTGECLCLEVSDDGSGMAPATLARIFEPFFTTRFIGRGLGLPAVLGVVHGHGGGIRVTSELGRGTTVHLYFPAEIHQGNLASVGNSATSAPSVRRKGHAILVVDDEPTVRKFAAEILTGAGYKVVTAQDGQEALELVRAHTVTFDAVLLDLTMPRLDGENTLLAIRMIDPGLPVVLMSGHSERLVAERFVGRGIADFLAKPFSAEDLAASIRTAIGGDGTPTA
jgi:signal transduction histidine kinase/ActR/RegA family two-component response regulator